MDPDCLTLDFQSIVAMNQAIMILEEMPPDEREEYKAANGLAANELIQILKMERDHQIEKLRELEAQRLEIAKNFALEKAELLKHNIQRDDRVVMYPVGSGRSSSKEMRGFDPDSLCQILKKKGCIDEERTRKAIEAT